MAQRNPIKRAADPDFAQPGQIASYDAQLDELLDAALDQTFPASDPVAVTPSPRRRRFDPDRVQA